MRLQIGDDEGAGKVGVIPGNADRAEQVAVMVVAGHELADALPNETESQRPLLVFRNNEGAPHFQRAVQHPQSGRGKGKVFSTYSLYPRGDECCQGTGYDGTSLFLL